MSDLIDRAKLFAAGHKPWAECYPIMREMIVEIERLRAELAVWEHRDECWADHVGGVPCPACERLEQAAEAAKGKP